MIANLDALPNHDLSWLAPRLKALHFTLRNIAGLGDLTVAGQVASADQQLLSQGPLGTVLRALVLGSRVSVAELDLALGPNAAKRLADAGLARVEGEEVACLVSAAECYGALTLADPYPTAGRPALESGSVLNVGNASVLASEFTVRSKVALAADIGCGQGLQAVLMAAHADRVIATDVNPRALLLTEAAAKLNGVSDRIECRMGSLLDPLQGQHFGLIVSNPPFVMRDDAHGASAISASSVGDGVVESLARGIPALLADYGWFTMICNWHHSADASPSWSERPRLWFANAGVDVWIVRNQTVTAEHYGRSMIEADGHKAGAEFDARFAAWKKWCAENNANFVSFGIIIARRRNGANWMRVESIPMTHRRGAGSDLIRNIFAGQTTLASLATPEALLNMRLRRSNTVQGVQVPANVPEAAKVPPGSVQLLHNQGWAMPQIVSPDVARFVQQFDGSRPSGEQAQQAIRAMGGTPPGPEQLARVLTGMVRSAFLVPVSASGEVLL
ncbi:MAG: class I SAM-dependent methyltransferase [Planctomycetes bacterium]|nr:class I SAM-dependent methyltransferase [Planctomycetota bacterium]